MKKKCSGQMPEVVIPFFLSLKKILLSLCIAGCGLLAQAQETVDTVIAEPPYDFEEETTEEGTTTTSPGPYYFLDKNYPGSVIDSFRLRQLPDTAIQSLKKDPAFWYADTVFKNTVERQDVQANPPGGQGPKKKTPPPTLSAPPRRTISNESWFQTLLWVVVILAFGAFIIMYLSNSNVRLFRRQSAVIDEDLEPGSTEDIFAINYQKEIDKAASAGNYRLAIRLMFLRLLRQLSEKNIIQYKQDKTNLDYLSQLRSSAYYADFFRLTRNYEYAWYGRLPVSDTAYEAIKNDFEHFIKKA